MTIPFDRPIAHRGYHDRSHGVIENSASAFEAAIANGFALECDLQLSADDEAIVFHDDAADRLLGRPGLVRTLSAAEITAMPLLGSAAGEAPQTFAALLDQVAGRTLIVAEAKDQHDRARNAALARRAPNWRPPIRAPWSSNPSIRASSPPCARPAFRATSASSPIATTGRTGTAACPASSDGC